MENQNQGKSDHSNHEAVLIVFTKKGSTFWLYGTILKMESIVTTSRRDFFLKKIVLGLTLMMLASLSNETSARK